MSDYCDWGGSRTGGTGHVDRPVLSGIGSVFHGSFDVFDPATRKKVVHGSFVVVAISQDGESIFCVRLMDKQKPRARRAIRFDRDQVVEAMS